MNAPWQGLVVLCATTPYDGMPMGDWHLARELSRLAPVLFVDPPMSRLTPLRNAEAAGALARPRLTVAAPGIARLTPVVQPGPSRRGLVTLSSGLTRRYLRRATTRLGGSVKAVISGWPQYPAFGACQERISVYWAKDDFVGGAALFGESARLLEVRERRVAAAADLVVAASPTVAATWRGRGLNPVLIPFGTDASAFAEVDAAPLPPDVSLPRPVAGFVGRLNDRTDLALLEEAVAAGLSLLIVGPKDPSFEPERFKALASSPRVRWTGPGPSPSCLAICGSSTWAWCRTAIRHSTGAASPSRPSSTWQPGAPWSAPICRRPGGSIPAWCPSPGTGPTSSGWPCGWRASQGRRPSRRGAGSSPPCTAGRGVPIRFMPK